MPTDKPYPPFITDRSPSNARGRAEYLHPTSSAEAQVVATYMRLWEAEENAGQVCAAVAEVLVDRPRAVMVLDEAVRHRAHRDALGELIQALGGSAPRPDECSQILLHGRESVVRGASDLESMEVLDLMRAELSAEYAHARSAAELDDRQRTALDLFAPP